MKQRLALVSFIFFSYSVFSQIQRLPLSGPATSWFFKERSNENWRPARVPGTIHTDLMNAKALSDPFFRDNEKWVQWVSNLDWEYKTEFNLTAGFLNFSSSDLVFEGLDTYAEVFFNGVSVLKADNMFLSHRIPVKPLLREGKNEVRVLFRSPLNAALHDLVANPQTLPAINDAMPLKTSPFTRKAGYHFGWDWGPRLVTSGIWRPVKLEFYNATRIENSFLETQKLEKKKALLKGVVRFQREPGQLLSLEVQIGKVSRVFDVPVSDSKTGSFPFTFEVADPVLWWTNGLGNPNLYPVRIELKSQGRILDTDRFNFGIRTVEVVHQTDPEGKSFFLKLNGKPVFMKGANYIPQDNFLPRVTHERYRKLLISARDANMNMLRVWGGGIYENDVFYSLCDSLGIMVWQDFMFACTMYPGTEKFRNSVMEEVRQNVRRLRNHCSIALWCGNNENETGWFKKWMRGGIPYSPRDSAAIYEDHKALFHSLIPSVLKDENPGRFYTRSSPSANDDDIRPDKIGYGDIHDWNVWFGTGDYRTYTKSVSRFHSEYGYQSFPAMESIRLFSEPRDWYEDSDVMDVHQKHPNGNTKIRNFASAFYPKPRDFEEFLYISQLQQAEAMRFAMETHRIRMPYCMGSLYWQLNDCWPAASWSSIDYYGRWKATQYFIKSSNQTIRLVGRTEKDSLRLHLINDALDPLAVHSLVVRWEDFSGKELGSKTIKVSRGVMPQSVLSRSVLSWPDGKALDSTQVLVRIKALDARGNLLAENHLFFQLPKSLSLPSVTLKRVLERDQGGYKIRLSANGLVKNLMIGSDDPDLQFSDNYFDVLPGETVEVRCTTEKDIKPERLTFRSLTGLH